MMPKCLSKCFKRKYNFFSSIAILFVLLALFLWFTVFLYPDLFSNAQGQQHEHAIVKIYSACLIFLTFALVLVAWIQLASLNKTSRSDFLLRIDDRYGSVEIIKARAIIQKFYCQIKKENTNISTQEHINKISEKIKEIGSKEKCADEFTHLLNFLDFLETISFFCKKNFISIKEIKELSGESLTYYYKIFKPWIDYRRKKYDNKNYYKQLEWLAEKIKRDAT